MLYKQVRVRMVFGARSPPVMTLSQTDALLGLFFQLICLTGDVRASTATALVGADMT